MTYDDFRFKWTGRPCDVDGAYGYQCMDLMHRYLMDVFGMDKATLAALCAKDVWLNFDRMKGNSLFEKIPNTLLGVPQKGDIFFFGATKYNPYGHVCIFDHGNVMWFYSFDQNYPNGSWPHIQFHTYANALGWLRYKGK